jgi:hypothetical protein
MKKIVQQLVNIKAVCMRRNPLWMEINRNHNHDEYQIQLIDDHPLLLVNVLLVLYDQEQNHNSSKKLSPRHLMLYFVPSANKNN